MEFIPSVFAGLLMFGVATVRVGAKKFKEFLAPLRKADHYASYKRGELGLAELVRHRGVMMKTLYERRNVSGGKTLVRGCFQYEGTTPFFGHRGKFIRPGDTILVEFFLGKEIGEFVIADSNQEKLPLRVFIHWENTTRSGVIVPQKNTNDIS